MPDSAATTSPPAARPTGSVVPPWLSNLASLAWRVTAVVGLVIVAWLLASLLWTVTASIAVAVVVTALFSPWVMRLRDGGRSRNAAAAIVWASAMLVVVAIGIGLVLTFLPSIQRLVATVEDAISTFQATLASLDVPPFVGEAIRDLFAIVRRFLGSETGASGEGVGALAAGIVTVIVLSVFLVFFFLRDGDRAWLWAFQAVEESKRDRITTAGEDALDARRGLSPRHHDPVRDHRPDRPRVHAAARRSDRGAARRSSCSWAATSRTSAGSSRPRSSCS